MRRVHAQLQDRVNAAAEFLFQLLQRVQVPGIEHQGFFADGVGADAQGQADMGIVQVIGRADADVMDRLASALVRRSRSAWRSKRSISVKKLRRRSSGRACRPSRGDPGGDEVVAGVLDGLDVSGRDVAGRADEGEVGHGGVLGGGRG